MVMRVPSATTEPVSTIELADFGPATGRAGRSRSPAVRALVRMGRAIRSNRKASWGAGLLIFFILVAALCGVIAPVYPNVTGQYKVSLGPSWHHLLGTNGLGEDLFAQVIWGTRPVLEIAFAVGLASTAVAVLIGVAAAYLGGAWDGVLNLITDILLVIPLFPLLIVIARYLNGAGTAVMIAVLTLTGWSYTARQLRSQALSLRKRDFLEAARVRGERRFYIIVVEIIPTMTSLLVASFLGNALYAVLFSSSLQFIGLGDPNQVSWGTMLQAAQNNEAFQTGQSLWIFAPGLCIAALGAAFALLNYAFDEVGNPALRPLKRKKLRQSALRRAQLEVSGRTSASQTS
jgi:peptide/nickel transport system permease protein